jgi:murein DD-endopeptidase MepM/ murein hydrolase activator NlpD
MVDTAEMIDRSDACDSCGTPMGGRRYLQAVGADLHSYCSETCLREARSDDRKRRWRARRRGMKVAVIGLAVAGACLAPHEVKYSRRPSSPVRAQAVAAVPVAAPLTVPAGWFGPEWPPTEPSILAALGRDAWIHPLAGPVRRMPLRDSRVFGAVRPGNRPSDCRNGHCGVDLGGEIWGEHVRAVHDGVVDFVQRGANPQRGGEFVRISHHGGTVFTQYFHLAAIPRRLERGVFVKSGDLIGLVGDTGVKESAPHLHFAVSIRSTPDSKIEKYIDPEPLIALWPLRVPIDGGTSALVTTLADPGQVIGSMPLLPGRKSRVAQKGRAAAAGKPAKGGGEAAAPAADEGDSGSGEPDSGDE